MTPSLYARLADLPLDVEGYDLEPLSLQVGGGWTRRTTIVRLRGGGHEGVGEDVTYQEPDQLAFQQAGPALPLAGATTLDGFSRRLDGVDPFPGPPQDRSARLYRRWAFESAALDLALRQAGRSLASALGRTPRPVRFVASLGLGDPPSAAPIHERLALDPGLRFKLDPTPRWDDALLADLAATGAVDTVDLKGHYHGPFTGTAPDPDLYGRVAAAFPAAWIEDPALTPETRPALEGSWDRVTWDAPFHALADLIALERRPRCVNVKPSRFGLVSELLRVYDACEAAEIAMYGGGQFELGPGRGQIQTLASLFHPDAPNDVAPAAYHAPAPTPGLPTSPLPAAGAEAGFR